MDIREAKPQVNRHPWEIARFHFFWQCMQNKLQGDTSVLADIGAGDLYVMERLEELLPKSIELIAVDSNFAMLNRQGRIKKFRQVQDLARESLDVVLLMDVLEHVADDRSFLTEVCDKVRPGGFVFITVPALPWLYSNHDQRLRHYRRYSKGELLELLASIKLDIEICNYFFTCLTPLRILQKILGLDRRQEGAEIAEWSHRADSLITQFLVRSLAADAEINLFLSKWALPSIGLSLGAVCQRK